MRFTQLDRLYHNSHMDISKLRKHIGQKIRELRKLKGLTQEELGERATLNYKFIGELERGKVNISLDSLHRVANALGAEIGDLFTKSHDLAPKNIMREDNPTAKLSSKDRSQIKASLKLLSRIFSKS